MTELNEECIVACLVRDPSLWSEYKFILTSKHFTLVNGQKFLEVIEAFSKKHPNYTATSGNADIIEVFNFLQIHYKDWTSSARKMIASGLKLITDADQARQKIKYFYEQLNSNLINREIQDLLLKTHKQVIEAPDNTQVIVDNALRGLTHLTDATRTTESSSLEDTIIDQKKKLLQRLDKNFVPCLSGIHSLDCLTGGWLPETYHLIGARSSMGKSALIGNMVKHMVTKQDKKIIVFNTETTNSVFINRWVSSELKIDNKLLRNPKLLDKQCRGRYFDFLDDFKTQYENKLFLFDSIYEQDKIFEKIISLHKIHKIDGVFIDLIGYVVNTDIKTENRQAELAKISKKFFEFRKRYPLFVAVTQQLNKAGDTASGDSNSGQGSVRESEETYHQADSVIFIYPYRNETKQVDKNSRLVVVDKNRDGDTGKVYLNFERDYLIFNDKQIGLELD